MVSLSGLRTDVENIINNNGEPVRIKYYTGSIASTDYDGGKTLSQSGTNFWTSGLLQPIDRPRGSFEANLLQQGLIKTNDSRLYLYGDVDTSGLNIKIGIGSPVGDEYNVSDAGIIPSPSIQGGFAYKKVYVSYLPNGSLTGE